MEVPVPLSQDHLHKYHQVQHRLNSDGKFGSGQRFYRGGAFTAGVVPRGPWEERRPPVDLYREVMPHVYKGRHYTHTLWVPRGEHVLFPFYPIDSRDMRLSPSQTTYVKWFKRPKLTARATWTGSWRWIRVGDTVEIVAGADRGRRGCVVEIDRMRGYARVDGVRIRRRPQLNEATARVEDTAVPGKVHVTQMKLIDPTSDAPADFRAAWVWDAARADGRGEYTLVRVSRDTGSLLEWPAEPPKPATFDALKDTEPDEAHRPTVDIEAELHDLTLDKLAALEAAEYKRLRVEFDIRKPVWDRIADAEQVWKWKIWRRTALTLEAREDAFHSHVKAEWEKQRAEIIAAGGTPPDEAPPASPFALNPALAAHVGRPNADGDLRAVDAAAAAAAGAGER